MAAPDDQVKKAAELKLWLESRIAELQEETERLKETLFLVDSTLRASTFKPAIDLMGESREIAETRELKRDKGGQVVATASVLSGSVTVEPKEGVTLKSSTPPFKSFLIGKILQGMKTKDEELASSGKISKEQVIRFEVKEEGGMVRQIVIENYREKSRLNEILSTIAWTFSRMLEK
jgi:predicted RNA-binding protein